MRRSSVNLVKLAVDVGHKSEARNDRQALLKALINPWDPEAPHPNQYN